MLLFLRELSGSTGMANWNGQSLSLRSILESLPPMQERYLRTLLPQEEWASLQGVLNGSVGMRGFFSLYRRAQNWSDRGYSTAARCMFLALTEVCQSSAWGGEGKKLADRARRRAEVLSGGGSFLDRFEYEARPLLSSLLDPVNMAAYVVGAPSYRWAKSMSLGRLLRTESVLGKVPFAIELLSSGVGLAVESGAFLGVSKLGHGFQGVHQDWSLSSLGREYGKTVADFGLMKIGGRLGVKAGGSLRGRADVLGSMLPDVGVYGGIVLSHPLGVWGGWNEEKSWSWVLGQSLVTMLHQKAAGRISDVLLMSHLPGLRRYQQGLEMEAQRLSREYFDRLRGRLISPQGYGEYAWALGSWGKGPMRFLSEGGEGSGKKKLASPKNFTEWPTLSGQINKLQVRRGEIQEVMVLSFLEWFRVSEALLAEISLKDAGFEGYSQFTIQQLSSSAESLRNQFNLLGDIKECLVALKFPLRRFLESSFKSEARTMWDGIVEIDPQFRVFLEVQKPLDVALGSFSRAYESANVGEMAKAMDQIRDIYHSLCFSHFSAPRMEPPVMGGVASSLRRDAMLQGIAIVDLFTHSTATQKLAQLTSMTSLLLPHGEASFSHGSMAEQLREAIQLLGKPGYAQVLHAKVANLARRKDWLHFSLPLLLAHHRGEPSRFWQEHADLLGALSKEDLENTHLVLNWLGLGLGGNNHPVQQLHFLEAGIGSYYPSWAGPRFDLLRQVALGPHQDSQGHWQGLPLFSGAHIVQPLLCATFGERGGQAVLGHALYHFYRHYDRPLEGFLGALRSPPEIRAQVVSLLGAAYGAHGGDGAFPYIGLRAWRLEAGGISPAIPLALQETVPIKKLVYEWRHLINEIRRQERVSQNGEDPTEIGKLLSFPPRQGPFHAASTVGQVVPPLNQILPYGIWEIFQLHREAALGRSRASSRQWGRIEQLYQQFKDKSWKEWSLREFWASYCELAEFSRDVSPSIDLLLQAFTPAYLSVAAQNPGAAFERLVSERPYFSRHIGGGASRSSQPKTPAQEEKSARETWEQWAALTHLSLQLMSGAKPDPEILFRVGQDWRVDPHAVGDPHSVGLWMPRLGELHSQGGRLLRSKTDETTVQIQLGIEAFLEHPYRMDAARDYLERSGALRGMGSPGASVPLSLRVLSLLHHSLRWRPSATDPTSLELLPSPSREVAEVVPFPDPSK